MGKQTSTDALYPQKSTRRARRRSDQRIPAQRPVSLGTAVRVLGDEHEYVRVFGTAQTVRAPRRAA